MYYGLIRTSDIANGPGVRLSLFVSGCTNHCKGCFQPETWDFTYGQPYTEETEGKIIAELSMDYYDGLTILGGEPFEIVNQHEIVKLIRRVRDELPGKTIWCYTGFSLDKDLIIGGIRHCEVTDEILSKIDVLVDGRFELDKRNLMLQYRGSENQRVIDMNLTRQSGKIELKLEQ